jgi:hypothetical protein
LDEGDKELYDLITKSDYNVELRSMNRPVQVTPEGQRELFIGGGEGFGINQDGKNIWVKPIYLPDIRKMDVSGIKSEDETIRHEAIEGKYQRMGKSRGDAHGIVNGITGEVEISSERKNLGNGDVLLQMRSLSGVTPFYIYNSQKGTYREP